MGHETSYSVDDNGNTVATESPTVPGHFFRNIVTAALLGGAAGANGNPAQGFFGGVARGGAAAVNDSRQQDLLKRQEAEEEFQNNQRSQQMQLEKNRDQREQDAFATQETLRKAQVAQANSETLRLNMLTQGADFEQHEKTAEQGKQHFSDFDAAGLAPVFKGIPETEMQDLIKNRPGASSFDWEATGVKLATGADGKPTYQYTYSAYDPKGKVPVSQDTIDQWKKDGMDKYYPEVFNILKPGKEIDATHYIELKRLDSKLFGDNLVRQKADEQTQEFKSKQALAAAQTAHAWAETAAARKQMEMAGLALKQQQMLPKALKALTDSGGDFQKLDAGDKVVIGESLGKLIEGAEKTVHDVLTADPSDKNNYAAEAMRQIGQWRGLVNQAFTVSQNRQDRFDMGLIDKGLGVLGRMSKADALAAINSSKSYTNAEKMALRSAINKTPATFSFNGQTFANIPPGKVALFLQTHPGAEQVSEPEDGPQPGDNSSSQFYRGIRRSLAPTPDISAPAEAGAFGG
ncbi:hypothetical protein SAMN05444167_0637 [Terriglobus roseus]|uniref:Uncharacterized protein n=2 Tax=Terriglobus roseus TaxID=392734 RepID=A0A1G7GBG9_9BACT|nr:hypothetical protein SAMN05444167_0637 [Terriglobus roseus]